MSACVHFATTYRIKYSAGGWFRDEAEAFFDALDELDCTPMHVDGSDLWEVEKTEARKLLKRLARRDPGDFKIANGVRINDIVTVLEEALKRGEPKSHYIHFFVF